ncbi:MAG: hypothetical protein R3200_14075 [Xanthomonadales bacterium]|nr:hypothetical protein [Xanthomonadales bacterium]
MWKLFLLSLVFGHSVRVCEVDGIVTYTDRDDVCVAGEELELGGGSGTFSTVDAWDAEFPEPVLPDEAAHEKVVIERYYYPAPASEPQQRVFFYGPPPPFRHRGFHRNRPAAKRSPDNMELRPASPGPIWQRPNRTSQRGNQTGNRPVTLTPR